MSSPVDFNDSRPVIGINDSVMLLIDHQNGLFQTVGNMPIPELHTCAAALAKVVAPAKMPVIITASVPQGPNGPLIPKIHTNASHAQCAARKGEINAWDNEDFVRAVRATGRKALIIVGTIINVCMVFPAISTVVEDYKASAMINASGTYSKMTQKITLTQVARADVVPMDTAAAASEVQGTQNREDAARWAEVYTRVSPVYQLLIESYSEAREVVTGGEKLGSQR